jgi:hypothetical protein
MWITMLADAQDAETSTIEEIPREIQAEINDSYLPFIPKQYLSRYLEARANRELLSLEPSIRVIDLRITELMQRMDSGEHELNWRDAKQALSDYRSAVVLGNSQSQVRAIQELIRIVDEGASAHIAWNQIGKLSEQKRKLVDSQRRLLVEFHQTIALKDINRMLDEHGDMVRDIILEECSDDIALARRILRRISEGTREEEPEF